MSYALLALLLAATAGTPRVAMLALVIASTVVGAGTLALTIGWLYA
jgi:hypothetical protein